MMPRPPASDTAAAISAKPTKCMPPWMIGCSIPNSSVILVFIDCSPSISVIRYRLASAALEPRFPALDERPDALLGVLGAHDLGMDRGDRRDRHALTGLDVLQRRFLHGAKAEWGVA